MYNDARNASYGAALRTGIARAAAAGFTYALFMDGDLTNDPHHIPRFVVKMGKRVDVIEASSHMAGGHVLGVPRFRVAISVRGDAPACRITDDVLTRLRDGRFVLQRPENYHVDIRRSYRDDGL